MRRWPRPASPSPARRRRTAARPRARRAPLPAHHGAAHPVRPMPPGSPTSCARRAAREPLQHLTGTAPFRHLELAVGPGVFVPRPETELLVDAVLPAPARHVVVDLCAGSGALALAIAHEVPGSTVYAVERSSDALVWLRRNAEGTAVRGASPATSRPALLADLRGTVDVVVSNPPYVPSDRGGRPGGARRPGRGGLRRHRTGSTLIPAVSPGRPNCCARADCWRWSTTTRTARPYRPCCGRRAVDGRRRPRRSDRPRRVRHRPALQRRTG